MEKKGSMETSSLVERDRRVIWHPFTQMKLACDPLAVVKGEGVYLFTECGKKILDGISSWWVNLHGHAHPYIIEKIWGQAKILEQVLFAGFTHEPAITLAERLLALLPASFEKIFYTDNGSTAVEAALKMTLQYFFNKNEQTKRIKVVCFKDGYHGDTFGAMSVAGKNDFNKPFRKHLFAVEMIDAPLRGNEENSLKQLQAILAKEDIACFIFEPLVLASGGMKIYSKEGLDALLSECKTHGVLTIADECMTGFGRLGPLFASHEMKEKPDIICLSKGITGGFLPLGVTAVKESVFQAFYSDDRSQALLHGHSYTANPLSCTAALASLDLLEKEECTNARIRIAKKQKAFVMKWKDHPKLNRCESIGTILVVEYKTAEGTSYFHPLRDRLYHHFLNHNILLRPIGNTLYVLTPYCITDNELEQIHQQIIFTLEKELF